MVRAATAQACSASISTPVRSTVSTWVSTSTWSSSRRKFTKTEPTSRGWQSGSMFDVCLAAWIPATRATASTSPWVIAPEAILAAVDGSMVTRQRATARRCEGSLAVTSTIRARPSGSRCVNSEAIGGVYGPELPADLAHRPAGADEVDRADVVARPFGADRSLDRVRQLGVAGAVAHDGAEVGLVEC